MLIGNGFNGAEVKRTVKTLRKYGVTVDIVGEKLGTVRGEDGLNVVVNATFLTTDPVLFDSLYVVGGTAENQRKVQLQYRVLHRRGIQALQTNWDCIDRHAIL